MSNNNNLHAAKKAKNDEFYTQYGDIASELRHYWDSLKGQRVLCPCDDYRRSNFYKYFKDNFRYIGLNTLIATNYDTGDGAWKCVYDGEKETVTRLDGDGDFRSQEVTEIKDSEADIVVTNPPFSLFREFVAWLYE